MNILLNRCRELLSTGASVDDVLELMKCHGLSQVASMSLLIELTGMTLRDAKTAVHMSPVWAGAREEVETFHEHLERSLDHLRKRKPETPSE